MPSRKCPNCGRENDQLTSYCENCMTELPPPDASGKVIICPECREENDYTEEYCLHCNEPLKPGQAGN